MPVTPYLAGQTLEVGMLRFATVLHADIATGDYSGAPHTIGTLVVPAFAHDTLQIADLQWTARPNNSLGASAHWEARINVGTATGPVSGRSRVRHPDATSTAERWTFSSAGDPRAIAAGNSVTYFARVENLAGGGQISSIDGIVRVEIYPDFP